ncbi:helix-turn-helix domain-containing protein [Pseudomonas sp. ODNR1LW]|nr:helix-turn-helix domain-containing protein [Pseudomonas sp. ODNR1LW]
MTLAPAIDPADIAIGARLRRMRERRGRNQSELGRAIGVTFQQVQKYENGRNRLSAARLLRCALYLQCAPGDILGSNQGDQTAFADTFFATPGGLTLARIWRDLPPDRRDILIHLAAALKTSAAEPARSA